MKYRLMIAALVAFLKTVYSQNITFLADAGVYGPTLEVAHAYYDQWPSGM